MPASLVSVLLLLAASASAQSGSGFDLQSMGYAQIAQDNTRMVLPAPVPIDQNTGRPYVRPAPPRDDVKPKVLRHLNASIAYCDEHMADCNGADNRIRDFAKTVGNGRCNKQSSPAALILCHSPKYALAI